MGSKQVSIIHYQSFIAKWWRSSGTIVEEVGGTKVIGPQPPSGRAKTRDAAPEGAASGQHGSPLPNVFRVHEAIWSSSSRQNHILRGGKTMACLPTFQEAVRALHVLNLPNFESSDSRCKWRVLSCYGFTRSFCFWKGGPKKHFRDQFFNQGLCYPCQKMWRTFAPLHSSVARSWSILVCKGSVSLAQRPAVHYSGFLRPLQTSPPKIPFQQGPKEASLPSLLEKLSFNIGLDFI